MDPTAITDNPFVNRVNSQEEVDTGSEGDYFIDPDGVVGANGDLPAGIGIHYYWRDAKFDPWGKFSVDYDLGVLHGSNDLNFGSEVKYKAVSCKMAYDVVNELEGWEFDSASRTVSVPTERLEGQATVKVNWREAPAVTETAKLTNFYTPVVRTIGFRLT